MLLIGKYGQIQVKDDQCVAVVTNKILEKKYGSTVTFGTEDLVKWLKRLKIESTENGAIRFGQW